MALRGRAPLGLGANKAPWWRDSFARNLFLIARLGKKRDHSQSPPRIFDPVFDPAVFDPVFAPNATAILRRIPQKREPDPDEARGTIPGKNPENDSPRPPRPKEPLQEDTKRTS